MKSSKKSPVGIKKGSSAIEKAQQEIFKLQQELQAGTLDKNKLETGLENLDEYLGVAQRVPPHSS